jgi:geranyl-CoA carboxylase alpha subunit
VFGDRHGNAIHVGERDCSVQRRHQKLIEESPSPAVSPDLRARMGEVSVKAVQALGYEGAGTLEFLLDGNGRFYFMEMNTRLQVEHRVSERLIGRDFVDWQLRIAAGEPLPETQHEFYPHGHAIEIRLCAEDPAENFLPQSGRFHTWREYCGGYGVMVDTAMMPGADVSPYYDSMVAKVVAHGPTRDEARMMLIGWLKEFASLGVKTNQGFLQRVLSHPDFIAGNVTTAFIAEHGQALIDRPAPEGLPDAALAAAILYDDLTPDRYRSSPRHLGPPLPIPMVLEIDGVRHEVAVHRERDGRHRIAAAGSDFSVAFEAATPAVGRDAPQFRYVLDGVGRDIGYIQVGEDLFIQRGPDQIHVRNLTRAATKPAGSDGSDGRLIAAMNGRIVAVHVAIGDEVAAGQPLVTLEAMKMEHVHAAAVAGKLVEIAVAPGEQVTTGRLLAVIEKTA